MKKVSELKTKMKITMADFSYKKDNWFICHCCNEEWEYNFICEKCSSGNDIRYDARGFEIADVRAVDICGNCCDCHEDNH